MNKNPGQNSQEYCENKKKETYKKIDDAIEYLKSANMKITKVRIAEEAGLSYSTMHKLHVREYLNALPEFSEEYQKNPKKSLTIEEYEEKLATAKKQLKISQAKNKRIEEEKKALAQKYRQLEKDYEYLLGEYQLLGEKKIVQF